MSTPVLTVSVPPPAQASGSTPPSVDDGACLLLHADDDARRTLVDLLQMCFARVHVCASYVEWMQLQQHQQQHQPLPRPHLIIMDAASVGGDEQELLALFRTDALLKSVPIIALTSTASEDAVLALVEAGAFWCELSVLNQVGRFTSCSALRRCAFSSRISQAQPMCCGNRCNLQHSATVALRARSRAWRAPLPWRRPATRVVRRTRSTRAPMCL